MRLILRADANAGIGTGHVMRCLALGQAWQDAGGSVELLTRCESSPLVNRLESENVTVRQLGNVSDWDAFTAARSDEPTALVLDGYHFDAGYQRRARDFFRPLLTIDDLADLPFYSADLVLNQNVYATELVYAYEPPTRLLLGCEWALLRREFRRWQGWQREISAVARRVLITLGGSDPDNVTLALIDALGLCELRDELEVVIVAGAASQHLTTLENTVRGLRSVGVRRDIGGLRNVDLRSNVTDMPELMAWADVAITGAGSTVWETAFMGLPALTIVLAQNQERVAAGLETAGAAINLGSSRNLDPERIASGLDGLLRSQVCRDRMSRRGRQLAGGNGTAATVAALRDLL
jgi:UDP-2,4-diacetamido-2,4,6-trideoxy-beta-L-altropyranose hydrolase